MGLPLTDLTRTVELESDRPTRRSTDATERVRDNRECPFVTQTYAPAPNLGFGLLAPQVFPFSGLSIHRRASWFAWVRTRRQDLNVQSLAISGDKSDVRTASGVAGFDAGAFSGS